MPTIHFSAKLLTIDSWTILQLPKSTSAKLPSRGLVMAKGTLNGFPFQTPLEPDGKGSHWFRIEENLSKVAGARANDTVTLTVEPTKEWPEPKIPTDLKNALAGAPQANTLWNEITPMARWDWIRWIRSTKQTETRKRRIEVALSKLKSGIRRPCCFNRSQCTEPTVSNNGILLEPAKTSTTKAKK